MTARYASSARVFRDGGSSTLRPSRSTAKSPSTRISNDLSASSVISADSSRHSQPQTGRSPRSASASNPTAGAAVGTASHKSSILPDSPWRCPTGDQCGRTPRRTPSLRGGQAAPWLLVVLQARSRRRSRITLRFRPTVLSGFARATFCATSSSAASRCAWRLTWSRARLGGRRERDGSECQARRPMSSSGRTHGAILTSQQTGAGVLLEDFGIANVAPQRLDRAVA